MRRIGWRMWWRASPVIRCRRRASGSCRSRRQRFARWLRACGEDVEDDATRCEVYETIDLPLVPVLLGMERAGVRIDVSVLGGMAEELDAEMSQVSEQIFGRLRAALQSSIRQSSLAMCCSTR